MVGPLISGKRASDWLPSLASSVLSAFLMILAALLLYNLAGNVSINEFNPMTAKLDFDLMSSRVLNSPTCLAWEEPYVDLNSQPKTLPHLGIINYNKLAGSNLDNCLGGRAYKISLKDLDGAWALSKNKGNAEGLEDMFFVNIHKIGESDIHRGVLTIKL